MQEMTAFKSGPSAAYKEAFGAVPQESLADGIGSGYAVLSYRGKVWSLNYKKQSYIFKRDDDGTPAPYIDVIIVRQAPNKSKSYYKTYDPNTTGERPICASLDGVRPDLDVQQKQADACALCKRNEWYTNAEGRKTRDCTDYKRLAVLLMPEVTKKMIGEELQDPVFLRIPPASLTDLGEFGKMMERQGFHHSSYVTRISFDPTLSHPKLVYKAQVQLPDDMLPFILSRRTDPQTLRITGEDKTSSIQGAAITHTSAPQLAPPSQGPRFSVPTTAAPPPATTEQLQPLEGEVIEADAALEAEIQKLMNA
jgi:hypothetical protein